MAALRTWLWALAALVAAAVLLSAGPAAALPLPPGVAAMIEAAANDPAALKTVVALARKTNPQSGAEIDAQLAALTARATAERTARLETQGVFEGWNGKGELGFSAHTGNTDDSAIAAGLKVSRDGPRWRHTIKLLADYKQEDGVVTKEKYSAAYEGNYRLGARLYAYDIFYWEKDKFAGIGDRLSEALGLGYRLIDRPAVKFVVEAGPALRQTNYIGQPRLDSVDLRWAGEFAWTFAPGATFTQGATAYLEDRNSTLTSTTALTTRLLDNLAARASFDVIHEDAPPPTRQRTDTTTRVTLVYDF